MDSLQSPAHRRTASKNQRGERQLRLETGLSRQCPAKIRRRDGPSGAVNCHSLLPPSAWLFQPCAAQPDRGAIPARPAAGKAKKCNIMKLIGGFGGFGRARPKRAARAAQPKGGENRALNPRAGPAAVLYKGHLRALRASCLNRSQRQTSAWLLCRCRTRLKGTAERPALWTSLSILRRLGNGRQAIPANRPSPPRRA